MSAVLARALAVTRKGASPPTAASRPQRTTSTRPCSGMRDARFAMAKEQCRERQTRRSRFVEAVSQTSGGLTGAFLRAGSKKWQVVARPRRAVPSLGAARPLSDRHSERSPGFRRRLCATASVQRDSDADPLRRACIPIQAGVGLVPGYRTACPCARGGATE